MGDDRVRDGAIAGLPGVCVEHLLSQSIRYGIRDPTDVDEARPGEH
jgi:hypothetical protein